MFWEIAILVDLEELEYETSFFVQLWQVTGLFRHFNKCDDCQKFYVTVCNFWNWINVNASKSKVISSTDVRLFVQHLLCLIVKFQPAQVFSVDITLLDVHMNYLNWSNSSFLCLPPFLNDIRMSMSTVFFLSQLDSGIFLPAECFPLTFDINVVNCFVITSEKLVLEMPLTDEKKKPCVTMGQEFF